MVISKNSLQQDRLKDSVYGVAINKDIATYTGRETAPMYDDLSAEPFPYEKFDRTDRPPWALGKSTHGIRKSFRSKDVRVIDGDTIDVRVGRQWHRIRIKGYDTPETGGEKPGYHGAQPYGMQAKTYLERMVKNSSITVYIDEMETTHERALATVAIGNKNLAELMISKGYGRTLLIGEQEELYSQRLKILEQQAFTKKAGMWSDAYWRLGREAFEENAAISNAMFTDAERLRGDSHLAALLSLMERRDESELNVVRARRLGVDVGPGVQSEIAVSSGNKFGTPQNTLLDVESNKQRRHIMTAR